MTTNTDIAGVTVRYAERDDVPLVLSFIRELAEYEKLADEAVATESGIAEAMFGPQAVIRVVIAECDEVPVGFALFFYNFSTFLGRRGIYLEDLFVQEAYRGRGVGRALLAYLAHLACAEHCGRLEWAVLDWNATAIEFYRKLGAVGMEEWTINRVSGDALRSLGQSVTFSA